MASLTVNNERGNKALAGIITLIIHAGLLLFLLWYIIITPIPPYPTPQNAPELEVSLASGGGGASHTEAVSVSKQESVDNKVKTPETNTPTVNNDVEPSTPIPSNKAVVTPKKIDTVPKPPQPSIELASAENKFKHAKASGGSTGQGQQGSGGDGTGTGHGSGVGPGVGSGSGGGKGFGYDLNGRQLEVRPQLVTNNPEQGQIVVAITVDQDGNVTEATPGVIGSTITDASLYVLVKNAAMKVKFNKSPNTPEQTGTVTFRFTIQ